MGYSKPQRMGQLYKKLVTVQDKISRLGVEKQDILEEIQGLMYGGEVMQGEVLEDQRNLLRSLLRGMEGEKNPAPFFPNNN